ncbi:UMP kinase [bacterium]|nr:UMP kinase [bacterium]
MSQPDYRRILLKISGEALAGEKGHGIDPQIAGRMAAEIAAVAKTGVQVGLVIGGGNFLRGVSAAELGMERVSADHMGMLATIINGLAMQQAIEQEAVSVRLMSAIAMPEVCEHLVVRRAVHHLEKNRLVIFCGGTGNPYFSTDTAAVLRALEIEADVIIKGTKVDGVFSADPVVARSAQLDRHLSYSEVVARKLNVMDFTAVTLCMENDLPLRVFNMSSSGNLQRLIQGEHIGTTISGEEA